MKAINDNFHRTVLTVFKQLGIHDRHRMVLAVSGGADSVALLHAVWATHDQHQLEFCVATFDHGLRAESAADVAYVEALCQKLDVVCVTGQAHHLLQMSGNLEANARAARYDFLASVAHQWDAHYVLTAHHADDQAETILLNLVRGAGSEGMQGMPIMRTMPDHPDVWLVRPLLKVSRDDIEAYCQANDLSPRHDPSNEDTDFTRNRIRHDVMPILQTINPQVQHVISQSADIAQAEDEFIQNWIQDEVLPHIEIAERIRIPRDVWDGWHAAIQRRILYNLSRHLGAEPTFQQIEQARSLTGQQPDIGSISQFNNQIVLRVDYQHYIIEQTGQPPDEGAYWLLTEDHITITPPTTIGLNRGTMQITTQPATQDESLVLAMPPDAVISVRGRQTGDRMLMPSGHNRSLKTWMIDQKIPRAIRHRIPLIIIQSEIAALRLPHRWVINPSFLDTDASQSCITVIIHADS